MNIECEQCGMDIIDDQPQYEINDMTICEECMDDMDPDDIETVG